MELHEEDPKRGRLFQNREPCSSGRDGAVPRSRTACTGSPYFCPKPPRQQLSPSHLELEKSRDSPCTPTPLLKLTLCSPGSALDSALLSGAARGSLQPRKIN
ncbi:Hypothetical predicted protein [Marmota monax]|uniref:Uncharacterized protein n=1 Tax=Marmota monax TaxID=9995 RepID=A0A5E4DD87_MARMO|nr:Hypothetical predicted protein [Marmota monax]